MILETILFEEGNLPGQEGDYRDSNDSRDQQVNQQEQRESGHHRPAPLAVDFPDGTRTVLVTGIPHRLLPITGEGFEQGPVGRLAFDKDTVLNGLVTLLGVIVGRFQERGGLRVMRAVPDQLLLLHPAGCQQVLGIEDTAVPVLLPQGIQHEGTGPAGSVHHPAGSRFPAHPADRIHPMPPDARLHVHQLAGAVAIGQELCRREALEGVDQAVVPVDVDVQPGNDVVERQSLRGKILILAGHLVQGIGHVERIVLLLRIKHQGQLITSLHHLDEMGPLA